MPPVLPTRVWAVPAGVPATRSAVAGNHEPRGLRSAVVRRSRWGLLLLVLALLGCGVGDRAADAGAASPAGRPTPVEGGAYTLLAPDRVSVTVPVGTCGRRGTGSASVEEGARQVRVTARVAGFDPPGRHEACTAELAIQQVTVRLAEPLGERQVVDTSDGNLLHRDSVPGR